MIGITMGDASGVGPELLLRAHVQGELKLPFVAYGDRSAIEFAAERLDRPAPIHVVDDPSGCRDGVLNLIDFAMLGSRDVTPGELSTAAGQAAVTYVQRAVEHALDGVIDGICTLPICKEASRRSFPDFTGHTELIADMCGVANYTLTLAAPDLVCTHVSTHVPLREAVDLVTTARVLDVIRLTHAVVSKLRPRARVAVAGLNPHAGEHGLFGDEEERQIAPAVRQARAEGIDATGPLPPDTMFMTALGGAYEAIVCMYHDQGHIAMKLHGFQDAVNVTVGLPIVRTSVDHGTAFDIAYQGVASTANLVNAFELAARLAAGRGDA